MHPGDESDPPTEVRITDRRRFTETGDARDESDSAAAPAPARAAESAPAPAPAPTRAAEPAPARADSALAPQSASLELGIDAVFFIFYQSALIAMGAPEVVGEGREPDLAEARQAIEFLRVLEAKTAGNLTAEEAATLRQLLDDAQLRFVHLARSMAGGRK